MKLALLNIWTPSWTIGKELAHVATVTTDALAELLRTHAPNIAYKNSYASLGEKTLQAKRAVMAKVHTEMVAALVEAVGREKAVQLGREALFAVGRKLGSETRIKLSVHGVRDLAKAAKVLYRVLDIDIHIEWQSTTQATLTVYRCSLARHYSELTCIVLSATDEGLMAGLCPNVVMAFEEKITDGCSRCTAKLKLTEKK